VADAVRQHFVAALARRAEAHEGALRQRLEARLAALRAEKVAPVEASAPAQPGPSALAGLLEHLQRQKSATPSLPAATSLPYFRRTWARLNADQRLAQSRSSLPQNAGPLNSQHVVHRALAQMRELSPAYFERFIAHADALLWLEQTNTRATPRKTPGSRRA
jgi:hypothetical protein